MTEFFSSWRSGKPDRLVRSPRWYAFRTRARTEKLVADTLGRAGFESYCPVVVEVRQWADRRVRVAFPMFPGFVFCHVGLDCMHEVLRMPSVATVLRTCGRPDPVCEDELDEVRKLEAGFAATGERPTPEDFLEQEEEIVVTDGPFSGMRGCVRLLRGRTRVVVKLSAMRLAVGVELDRSALKVVA
jgi:transcription antitermination factor NusG